MAQQTHNSDDADDSHHTSVDSLAKPNSSSNTNGICGGDIAVSAEKPSPADIARIADLPILDASGTSHPFKTLYTSAQDRPQKALVIFIRHFFCGNCQEYIRTLATSITPESLQSQSSPGTPPPTLTIIGCGDPSLIPMYVAATACRFPIYADPTRALYDALGMTRTLELGPQRPDYIKTSLLTVVVKSLVQGVMSGRGALKGGDFKQVGGEFWFVDGEVRWCRRMRNTRDHAEIPVLRGLLGLEKEEEEEEEEEEGKAEGRRR